MDMSKFYKCRELLSNARISLVTKSARPHDLNISHYNYLDLEVLLKMSEYSVDLLLSKSCKETTEWERTVMNTVIDFSWFGSGDFRGRKSWLEHARIYHNMILKTLNARREAYGLSSYNL